MSNKTILVKKGIVLAALGAALQIPAWIAFGPKAVHASRPEVVPETLSSITDLNVFAKLAKQVVPSVVNLSSVVDVSPKGDQQNEMLQQFFSQGGAFPGMRPMMPQSPRKEMSLGTGFVIDASGILLTNNHVVAHSDKVEIQLTESTSEKTIEGKVIGRDPDLDVAIIRFKPPHPLTALKFGDSEALQVGEFVMAVGNPYGQGHSVSHGIVSAKGRVEPDSPIASYLQTDAPINPGNSGGPLLNLKGEVIGINNAIDARAQGISFAIPINYVKKILPELQDKGKVSRGFIGATIGPLTPELAEKIGESKELQGTLVTDITLGGPAAKAGIRPYDVITAVGNTQVHSPSELVFAVTSTPVGEKVPITVLRSGKSINVEVKIEQRPSPQRVSQR